MYSNGNTTWEERSQYRSAGSKKLKVSQCEIGIHVCKGQTYLPSLSSLSLHHLSPILIRPTITHRPAFPRLTKTSLPAQESRERDPSPLNLQEDMLQKQNGTVPEEHGVWAKKNGLLFQAGWIDLMISFR